MAKVRGVRFSTTEEKLIEEFLRVNPIFDFSTLAKASILEFIKNPQIHLQAVGQIKKAGGKNVRPTS